MSSAAKARPLDWIAGDAPNGQFFATTPFGKRYEVKCFPFQPSWALSFSRKPFVDYPTEQDAKAAAQDDFENDVRSCLPEISA